MSGHPHQPFSIIIFERVSAAPQEPQLPTFISPALELQVHADMTFYDTYVIHE